MNLGVSARQIVSAISLIAACTLLAGPPIPSKIPDKWKIDIETTGLGVRDRFLVSVEAFTQSDHELVVRHARSANAPADAIIVQKMKKGEAEEFWKAFAAIYSRFQFSSATIDTMDGTFLRIDLTVGKSTLGMRLTQMADLADVAPELVRPLGNVKSLAAEKVSK